jgi:acyl-CoA thioesterase-2
MPLAPDPNDIKPKADDWPWIMERRPLTSYPGAGQSMGWVRMTDPLPDDPRLHVCGLAMSSDAIQFGAARSIHPAQVAAAPDHDPFMGASLDHAMWFHRPMRADQWHLYDWDCHGLTGARGMTVGNLFAADGTHVATVAQEVLLRERK